MIRLIALSGLVLAMLAAAPASADDDRIEFLAAFNLTGPESALDIPSSRGARIAVERLNAAGGLLGRPVELVMVDTKSDAETTRATVAAALAAHPHVVAGLGFSDSSYVLAAGPVFQAAGLPFVTPGATDPTLPDRVGNQIFLACYSDAAQARAMADYAHRQLGLRRIAVWVDDDVDFTVTVARFFSEAFTALGGRVVRSGYRHDDPQPQALVDGLGNADAVYSASRPAEGVEHIRLTRAAGSDIPLLSADGWDASEIVDVSRRSHLEGIYFTTHRFLGVDTPEMHAFVTAYESRFEQPPPNAFAPLGYDTINLLASAIRAAKSTDPDDIREAIATTRAFPGIVGDISFEPGQQVPVKAIELIALDDGIEKSVGIVTPK
jgi:branched-chain amino acid transport system substrate-binding protein